MLAFTIYQAPKKTELFWQNIQKVFTSMNNEALGKLFTILIILISVMVIIKIFDFFLKRWERKLLSKLHKSRHREVASFDTKVTIIRRIANTGIFFFGFVFFLFQFQPMRQLGTGLLASAGLAGIVLGMAAQSTLANLISGISISFSQPFCLGDAVIFKNDFGWIEEILLMHTTIRTWDNRRIIIPNSLLANEVIENWTVKDPALLGVVMLYADYTCDVDRVRKWVQEIVNNSAYSTAEKLSVVHVVDFTEKSMQLRILAKGPDAPATWDLRCEIREKLIKKFKEEKLPLPQIRVSGENFKVNKA